MMKIQKRIIREIIYFTNFENNIPKEIKPSNELMEKQRQLDFYIKTEE